jgi:hypothetical protein
MNVVRHGALLVATLGLLTVPACGDDRPPPGAYINAPCRGDFDCAGLACVDPGGGTCQAACRNNFDCGPGYSCDSENRHGTGGKIDVCMPN